MNHGELKRETHEDFRMWYRITIDDINFVKMQQWRITYYVILLLAGIAGFYQILHSINKAVCPSQKHIMIFLGLMLVFVGTTLLLLFQHTMANYRKRLTRKILPELAWKMRQVMSSESTKSRVPYTSFFKDFFIVAVLILSMIGAWYLLTLLPIKTVPA